jgi:hypothetical protein
MVPNKSNKIMKRKITNGTLRVASVEAALMADDTNGGNEPNKRKTRKGRRVFIKRIQFGTFGFYSVHLYYLFFLYENS